MGRKKLDEKEVEERRVKQQAMCYLMTQRRSEMNHADIEEMWNIANHAKDGAVFRRISRGKQLISNLKIDAIIQICDDNNIFDYGDVAEEMTDFFKKRDNEILKSYLPQWQYKLQGMAEIALAGDANFKDKVVKYLEEAIKTIKGIK